MFMDFGNALGYYGKISKNYSELLEKVNKIYKITGMDIDELIYKLLAGYELKPTKHTDNFEAEPQKPKEN